jgi:hypothetical protein
MYRKLLSFLGAQRSVYDVDHLTTPSSEVEGRGGGYIYIYPHPLDIRGRFNCETYLSSAGRNGGF